MLFSDGFAKPFQFCLKTDGVEAYKTDAPLTEVFVTTTTSQGVAGFEMRKYINHIHHTHIHIHTYSHIFRVLAKKQLFAKSSCECLGVSADGSIFGVWDIQGEQKKRVI